MTLSRWRIFQILLVKPEDKRLNVQVNNKEVYTISNQD